MEDIMYYLEESLSSGWYIMSPKGEYIAFQVHYEQAERLLKHLNRK